MAEEDARVGAADYAVRPDEGRLFHGSLPGIADFNTLFGFLYCMLASTAVLSHPVLGGALFMIGRVVLLFLKLIQPGDYRRLPTPYRRTGIILGAVSALLALAVLLVYPLAVQQPLLWLVFSLASLVLLMNELTGRIERAGARRGVIRARRVVRAAELMIAIMGIAALILFLALPHETAWYLLGGYALCCLIRLVSLARGEEPLPQAEEIDWNLLPEYGKLIEVNAYRTFNTVMMITVTALQVTMILIYTLIGTTADSLLKSMGIAFVCGTLASWGTTLLMRRSSRRPDFEPSVFLLTGLALWFFSLLSFALWSFDKNHLWSYIALALCTTGVTVATRALQTLESTMRDIARFATGVKPGQALEQAQTAMKEYAALIGGMIALLGLMTITLVSGGSITPGRVTFSIQPLLLLPALALVVTAIPAAFRFPLDRRWVLKLRRFLQLEAKGESNLPLQKQLEDVIIKVHRKHYGIKLVILILRPMFYSKVVNKERVHLDPDISCVFVCNHGELYGPIVSNIFIPFSFRPWVIDEISEPDRSSTYLYRYTLIRQKWIPKRLRWPAAKMTAAFLKWVVYSLDSITVYRDKPRELIKTFRLTAAAMEAGDNILLFPENPNDASQAKAGYLRDGIGEFHTGFVMIAQMYHKKTGKRAQFIPIYADKKLRTLEFGEAVRYDPKNPPAQEKIRVSRLLRDEMLRMAGLPPENGEVR